MRGTHGRLFANRIITFSTRTLISFGIAITLAGGCSAFTLAGGSSTGLVHVDGVLCGDGLVQHNGKVNVQISGDLVFSSARDWEVSGGGICHQR